MSKAIQLIQSSENLYLLRSNLKIGIAFYALHDDGNIYAWSHSADGARWIRLPDTSAKKEGTHE